MNNLGKNDAASAESKVSAENKTPVGEPAAAKSEPGTATKPDVTPANKGSASDAGKGPTVANASSSKH